MEDRKNKLDNIRQEEKTRQKKIERLRDDIAKQKEIADKPPEVESLDNINHDLV